MESENILEAKQVSVAFRIAGKFQKAIYDIDLSLRRGEVLAIVGESGSGKSTLATAVMGLHNPNQTQITGSILLDEEEVIGKTGDSMASIRGSKVGMIKIADLVRKNFSLSPAAIIKALDLRRPIRRKRRFSTR